MFGKISMAIAVTMMFTGAALADPIEGTWKTKDGPIANIRSCGGSVCIVMKTGNFVGKQIGKLKPDGENEYSGTITDPNDDKTYSGSARLKGSSLSLTGCALKIFCKTQVWTRV